MPRELGLSVWEVIGAAATKPFGFMPFYPGPGLGGHCLPSDPYYLSWKVRLEGYEPRFISFADEIKGTFVKYADGKLTLKVDDKDKEFNIPADLKVKRKFGKDGEEKEIAVRDILSSKFMKEGTKMTVTTDGDKVTDVKMERKGK